MKLEINVTEYFQSDKIDDINLKDAVFFAETDYKFGTLTKELAVGFTDNNTDENNPTTISINLDRNQASYLYNFLNSFLNEEEE